MEFEGTWKMEETGCNICNSNRAYLLFEIQRYSTALKIKRCPNCGLVYLSPRPTHEELGEYYSQVYDYDGFLANAESIKQRAQFDLSLIQEYKKEGNLLEIGCMYGFLLDLGAKQGFNSYGVEISQKATEWARENLGVNVQNDVIENVSFEDNFFDVVYLSHLIEHLEDPSASLKIIHRIIRDDGVLIMKCPNFGSLMSKLTGRHWWWLAPPEHLYHFTPRTIRAILTKAGFKQIELHTQRGDLSHLRYFTVFFAAILPIPRDWKVNYRAAIDAQPRHISQRILLSIYNLARPIVALIHKLNMGEEMIVVARK